ncbi:antibiotic biosynthesis monooxygenase family protein [Chloroflexota bacterium]
MFARMTTAYISINKTDEAIRIMRDNIMPVTKTQKGFRQILVLSDRKTDKGVMITLWDAEKDAIANEQSGYYQDQVEKLAPYYITTPIREGFEVTAQD